MLAIILLSVFTSAFAAPLVEDRSLKLVDPIEFLYVADDGKFLITIFYKNCYAATN